MLLRSVSEHVKNQNWTAISIDLFIVVIGVFIGIQVSNWNAARLEEEKSHSYIERIREDLVENLNDFEQRKAYFIQVRSHAISALNALNLPSAELGEQFLIDIYQTSQIMPRNLARSILLYHVQAEIRNSCDDIASTGENNEPILSLPTSCTLDLTSEEVAAAVSAVKKANILQAHTQRISQLDNILIGINLVLKRIVLIDNYLKGLE